MKRKPSPDLVELLTELWQAADCEARISMEKPAREAWREIQQHIEGAAQRRGIEYHEIRTTPD